MASSQHATTAPRAATGAVDGTRRLVALLDAVDAMPDAAELRARSYALLDPARGAYVVDVGCGTGLAVAELNQQGAQAVGVDVDESMLAVARERWPDATFHQASAYELPLADGAATGYRAEKVFPALADPARALDEANRVLGPGGRVVLISQDLDTFVIDSDQPELTRAIVAAHAEAAPSPRVARASRTLLLDHGFTDVTVEVHTPVFTDRRMLPALIHLARAYGTAHPTQATAVDEWIAEQTRRADADRMFLAIPMFVTAASKPSGPAQVSP